jgi:mannose-6-phosphate isomerase-like protein (cupin superfamily)
LRLPSQLVTIALMKLPILLASTLTVALTVAVFAADPDGFAMYKAADIKARVNAAKLDDHKAGLDRAGTWGNHGLLLVRREGDGEVEVHNTQVDVITVMSGEGTLLVGGTVVGGRDSAPNEIRGKSMNGGERHAMAPGDVFHIPAKVPHQMLVPKSLTIQVVKVDTK